MDKYIINLLDRLRRFGDKLNTIESFVDKTWVLFQPGQGFQTYRFLRNNKLLITVSGNVFEHQWEYLPPDGLYLKKGGGNGTMFRHAFFLDSLFIMQIEGSEFDPVLFYNEISIPNGDVYAYLNNLYKEKIRPKEIGNTNYFFSSLKGSDVTIGTIVYDINMEVVGDIEILVSPRILTVSNGRICKIEYIKYLQTEKGRIKIISNTHSDTPVNIGERVIFENGANITGKIKVLNDQKITYIVVKNGKIQYYLMNKALALVNTILFLLLFLILMFILFTII